jgi:hypothetical protein
MYVELLKNTVDGRGGILPMLTDNAGRQRQMVAALRLGRSNGSLP